MQGQSVFSVYPTFSSSFPCLRSSNIRPTHSGIGNRAVTSLACKYMCIYNAFVQYEWDETKRQKNLGKHGLDFPDADLVHESPTRITVPAPSRDGENRWADLAVVRTHVLVLIYTWRGEVIRCISFRRASRKERRYYHEATDYAHDQ